MNQPSPTQRFGTRALLACSLLSVGGAHAQQAYFSIEGEITNALGQHEIYFDLPSGATTSDTLSFRTYNNAGLNNAAGDPTQASNIDPVLDLFSFSAGLSASNDDGAIGVLSDLDALLTWPGIAESGGALPSTGLPAGDKPVVREGPGLREGHAAAVFECLLVDEHREPVLHREPARGLVPVVRPGHLAAS